MLRRPLFTLLVFACLSALFPAAAEEELPSGIVVLMYHRFGEEAYPSTNSTLHQLDLHIEELQRSKYSVLPLPEIIDRLRRGEPLPERTVAITIDDAYRSAYQHAWPRFKAAGLPFTVFVSSQPSDQGMRDFMTWDQLRELQSDPLVTIGHHSVSHWHMPDLSDAELEEELERASARFAAELGTVPTLFAYPYGEFGQREISAVQAAGFMAAFGQHSGALQPPSEEAEYFTLPRFALNETYGELDRFRQVVNAIPLEVHDLVPRESVVHQGDPSPAYGFTVSEEIGPLDGLNCFVSDEIGHRLEILGRRVELRFQDAFPVGRVRINCTLYAGQGRWRWFGRLFTVLPD